MNRAGAGLDALEAALRQIQLACREADSEEIRAAVERRGVVLAELVARLGEWAPAEREAVRETVLSNTREAEQVLRVAQSRFAAEFQRLADGARALRRYGVPQEASSALDRCG